VERILKGLIGLGVGVLFAVGGMNQVRLGISSDTASAKGRFYFQQNSLFGEGEWLHRQGEERDWGEIGFGTSGPFLGYPTLQFTLFCHWAHSGSWNSLPIGGSIRFTYPYGFVPWYLEGSGEYAPPVLTFGTQSHFYRYQLEWGVQLTQNGEIFVGYRNLHWDSPFESNWYGGVGFLW
jgi:hypothetical protein